MREPYTDVQDAIDALLRGEPMAHIEQRYTLTPEEWANVQVAEELTSIQVAERSHIKPQLKEHLMVTAEQERLLGEAYYEDAPQEEKKGRPWWLVALIVLGVLAGFGALIGIGAMILGVFFVSPSSSSYSASSGYAPAPDVYYGDPGEYIEPFGENTDAVYIVQQTPDATFGDLFTLESMIVQASQYGPNDIVILLVWDMAQGITNSQYSVMVSAQQDYTHDRVPADIGFPLSAGDSIATRHQIILYGSPDQPTTFTVEVIDRATDEPLLLGDGSESLPLRLQPAVTIPSQLVPEEGTPPTATPIEP